MKTVTVYSDKDLVLRYVETMPEKPVYSKINVKANVGSEAINKVTHSLKMDQYNSALQACKDSSIPFEDQKYISFVVRTNPIGAELKPDTFYTIELNEEIEIVHQYCSLTGIWFDMSKEVYDIYTLPKRVGARLKPELNSISEEKTELGKIGWGRVGWRSEEQEDKSEGKCSFHKQCESESESYKAQFCGCYGMEMQLQNELWKQAIKLYNTKNHTQDGRDLLLKNFVITRKGSTL